jgi:SAM-dependent methyltransferase
MLEPPYSSMTIEQLRAASKAERTTLYSSMYDELFRRVPYHPQIARKSFRSSMRREEVSANLTLLKPLLRSDQTFLELGPGDCQLCFEVARHAKKVYAIDVSNEITSTMETPDNFQLILSDGSSVAVPPGSIDVAFSSQLMEHLHPEDAATQLRQIHDALAPGGLYICLTPHRFGGPADVSRFFDEVARGFHLKEYTNRELRQLFTAAGFSRVQLLKRIGSRPMRLPLFPAILIEALMGPLPRRHRRTLYKALKKLLAPRLISRK